ncbi:MAG TPA: transposase, partial [Candidatus Binatia bacterium]|nr:transposase [Candidatus Binatia bacterium]
MARPLRIEYDGALYHVTSRGNGRKAIFKDDGDRELFLTTLGQVIERFHWLCHAYCLMGNHYHLMIETPDGNLSKGMRQLNGVYTQAFNRRHHRVGHLFQGRFKGILVQKESHFLEVCRYVVLNPVRAKAVKHPREWGWSSYRATGGLAAVPRCLTVEEILSHFGQRRGPAQEKYREYVREGIGNATIWENLEAQSLLGLEGFADALRGHVTGKKRVREIPKGQRLIGRASLKKLFDGVGKGKAVRDRLISKAVNEHGYSQMEVAR